jgi:hypothetical protein
MELNHPTLQQGGHTTHAAIAAVCKPEVAEDMGANDGALATNKACGQEADALSTNSGIHGDDAGNTAIGRAVGGGS